ncbi:MAG: acylneuraminate cytidylyltransferase family protein [Deltaproteobacteria bacterium]|nr:MAG: acylneuraminate cytidylyltransferase family protein [Deltaproteobacteria bacterium]
MCPIVETDNTTRKAKQKVLAIIPARGGSRGLPRKNIRDLCGKPLVAYSIEVALRSKLIDRVVVSTEDEEIAEVSKSCGAEVPFLRPKGMAQDRSSIGEAIDFTINKLRDDGYNPNILVTLYPTHPFRTPKLLDFLVSKNLEGYSPVNTVKLITHTNLSIFSTNGAKNLTPLLSATPFNGTPSRKSFFRSYGLFLGTIPGCFDKPYLHVIKDSASLIDIDSLFDFYLAEEVIKGGLFDFELG